jgi:hypothetical protein
VRPQLLAHSGTDDLKKKVGCTKLIFPPALITSSG